jgi:hypothetical protein
MARPAAGAAAGARTASLLAAALLLAALAPAAALSRPLTASLSFDAAQMRDEFAWSVVAAPPEPLSLQIPDGQAGTIAYNITYKRSLLSTKVKVRGPPPFETGRGRGEERGGSAADCGRRAAAPKPRRPGASAAAPSRHPTLLAPPAPGLGPRYL